MARQRPGGINLGLPNVDILWQGYSGLNLLDVISKLRYLKRVGEKPNVILLHCGGNSIGLTPCKHLRWLLKQIVKFIIENFEARIIWSEILPRNSWRYSHNVEKMNRTVRRLNSFAGKHIIENNGFYIRHPDLQQVTSSLYKDDGVHLKFLGNCIFLCQISSALEKFIIGGCAYFE